MKRYKLIVWEEAEQDITDAFYWYKQQLPGLESRFLKHLDDCFKIILNNPESFQFAYKKKRQAVVKTFPFVIIYEVGKNEILVSAVFHTSRNPGKLKKRK